MPPRKKQKQKPTEPEPQDDDDAPVVKFTGQRAAQSTTGIFGLPLELLWLISSHFGLRIEIPQPILRGDGNPVLPREFRERTSALRALSNTCAYLREIFRPMLWQSWNVCVEPWNSAAFYKALGDKLLKASNALVRESNKETISFIRVVNVVLTRYSSNEVLPAFARCLTQIPNLHTLQIVHAHTQMTTHLKNGFDGVSIPTLQRIVLPEWAHEVLRCCPNVRHVICTAGAGGKLVTAIAKACPKVEIVEGFWISEPNLLKRLIKGAPNITEVRVQPHHADADNIKALAGFKKLTSIQFFHEVSLEQIHAGTTDADLEIPSEIKDKIPAAREVLRSRDGAKLSVRYTHEIPRKYRPWGGGPDAMRHENWQAISETPFPIKTIPLA
ncbi:hypothetical protein MKEN_01101800 [Mycena kentingensis (nom. inval.)]|nr:hypothetical protein MKEN_01101800 [Mycena kentingensis (nom. inval.)]